MMARPRREPTGLGLRPQPGGLVRLRSLLGRDRVAEATWDELEEALIAADVGAQTTGALIAAPQQRAGAAASGGRSASRWPRGSGAAWSGWDAARSSRPGACGDARDWGQRLAQATRSPSWPWLGARRAQRRPRWADASRAAAIEQVRLWGEQIRIPVVPAPGADPGGLPSTRWPRPSLVASKSSSSTPPGGCRTRSS